MRQGLWVAASLGLAAAASGETRVFTVGPHGSHATIQAGVDAALAAGGDAEVKVERGRFKGQVVAVVPEGRTLSLTGGWDAGFAVQGSLDPGDAGNPDKHTVLDGGGSRPVVQLDGRGALAFRRFSLTGGGSAGPGYLPSALSGRAHESGHLLILQNLIWGSHVATTGPGAGIVYVNVLDRGHLRFADNWVQDNSLESITPGSHANGGTWIWVDEQAHAEVLRNQVLRNVVRAPGQANSAAMNVDVRKAAYALVEGNVFAENRAEAASGEGYGMVDLGVAEPSATGRPVLEADRNEVYANVVATPGEGQLNLVATGGRLLFGNGLVADGGGDGIQVLLSGGGEMRLANLTVTGLAGTGLRWADGVDLVNSLFFDNGSDLVGTPRESHNLYGVDPLFLDPPSHDYRLGPGSPAIDGGSDADAWGLLDVYGETRRVGTVDVGADEAPYVDGEPACRAFLPDLTIGASAPICRCVIHLDLREARCGFLGPDVFVDLRLPLSWKAGEALRVPVTLHPWRAVAAPYAMSMEAKVQGQWLPQAWLGPTMPGLKLGQLAVEPFDVKLPAKGRTPLRGLLEYQRLGDPNALRLGFEIVAGDPNPQPN